MCHLCNCEARTNTQYFATPLVRGGLDALLVVPLEALRAVVLKSEMRMMRSDAEHVVATVIEGETCRTTAIYTCSLPELDSLERLERSRTNHNAPIATYRIVYV
jgi:hypothetical protein